MDVELTLSIGYVGADQKEMVSYYDDQVEGMSDDDIIQMALDDHREGMICDYVEVDAKIQR